MKKITYERFVEAIKAIAGAVIAIALLLGYVQAPETAVSDQPTARGVSNFDDLAIGGDLTVTGDVATNTDLTVDDTFAIDDTAYALTGTQTLTPTASYYLLNATSTLTLTLGATAVGDVLILHNVGVSNTIVTDTGATQGGGAVTIGPDDIGLFIYGNSKWVEIASPDNS